MIRGVSCEVENGEGFLQLHQIQTLILDGLKMNNKALQDVLGQLAQ